MEIIKYYGSDTACHEFINHDAEPLMAVIAHDGSHAVVSLLDEGCEHHILLEHKNIYSIIEKNIFMSK